VSQPLAEVDASILYDLAYLGQTDTRIAEVVGCSQSTLSKRMDLQAILAQARADRAVAIAKLWGEGPGAIRSADRAGCLTELVRAAERRSIQRHPEQRKISGESSGEDAQRSTLSAREERQSPG
jgi:hypothetical protein